MTEHERKAVSDLVNDCILFKRSRGELANAFEFVLKSFRGEVPEWAIEAKKYVLALYDERSTT